MRCACSRARCDTARRAMPARRRLARARRLRRPVLRDLWATRPRSAARVLSSACSPAPSRRSSGGRSRSSVPAVLMWLWEGRTPARGRLAGFWFSSGTFARGHLLAVYQHPRLWRGARLDGLRAHARARRDHGPLQRALGYAVARWLPAAGRRALAGRHPGRVAARRVVARLVPVGLLLAVARLFADRHAGLRALRRSSECMA